MAMMALRKTSRPVVASVPTMLLLTGTGLFSGIIFYEAFSKDERAHWLIKFGGSASIFGWLTMALL